LDTHSPGQIGSRPASDPGEGSEAQGSVARCIENGPTTPEGTWIDELIEARSLERFDLHTRHMNPQMVGVLRTIGFDRHYVRGRGAHLWDKDGNKYLDLLSGWGTFALGRNHPGVNRTLQRVLDLDLPNLGHMDISVLSGLLAEELLATQPAEGLERVFFANSGAETAEGAMKMARYATGREKVVFCNKGFHGLTMGALSINGEAPFRTGFGPFLPGCESVPFNDLEALERALSGRDVAAFVVEPIQGKGVYVPDEDYLRGAASLCAKHGTLFVADEVQTGLGRTGRMWACEHWGVEPDILLCAKALSGGQIPVGAIMGRRWVFDKVFSSMDRAVVHSSTFGGNNMAMAAGLATLRTLRQERLVERAASLGERLIAAFRPMVEKHEFVKDVRGRGLMIGFEFGSPRSLKLKAAWKLLETAHESLFCQMVLIPLFEQHRILAQVSGHGVHVIKFLPPLVIDEDDCDWMVGAMDDVIGRCHQVPGSIWNLGRTLAGHAMSNRRDRG